jgi:uncharacterized protein YdaU (DUF1376 family)
MNRIETIGCDHQGGIVTELPYRSEHVNDAIADSEELTNEELGAYVRLQRALWRAGGYLPADKLARFARAGKRWGKLAPTILSKLTVGDGMASCSQLLELLLRTRERRSAAVDKARKGGMAKASRGTFASDQNGRLNAVKPLESHNTALLEADPKRANQNQKIESSSLSLRMRGEAAGHRERKNSEDHERVYNRGVAVLMERVKLRRLSATSQVGKWLAVLENPNDLEDLIEAAKAEGLAGAQFVAIIDQRVKILKRERECGPSLPLGFTPNVVPK